MWISLDNLKPWMTLFSPSVQIDPMPQRLMLSRVHLDEHLVHAVLWSLHGTLLVIPMKPPDDHGFAPNVDLCLLAFIFLAFPFALSFRCLPSHPESATCDFWERTGASGATGLGTAGRTCLSAIGRLALHVLPSPFQGSCLQIFV